MLGSAHASTAYGIWRIKSKTQAIATDNTYCALTEPNLTSRNLNSPSSFNLYNRLYYRRQRNHADLLRTHFRTLWRSEIHINLKIDADALNRRWRRFCVRRTVYYMYQGQWRKYAVACPCVYDVCTVKNKIENETNLTDCTSNVT
jgi:hypothetical protein